jgi:hypothetical protein
LLGGWWGSTAFLSNTSSDPTLFLAICGRAVHVRRHAYVL